MSAQSKSSIDSHSRTILEIKALLHKRDEARTNAEFVKADQLRDKLISEYKIEIIDQKNGPSGWKFKDGSSKKLPTGIVIPEDLRVNPRCASTTAEKADAGKNKRKKDDNSTRGSTSGVEEREG